MKFKIIPKIRSNIILVQKDIFAYLFIAFSF